MRKLILTLAVFGVCAVPAHAVKLEGVEHEIAVCSKIEDGIKRLECFDAIVSSKGLSANDKKDESNNQWEIITDKSKIDDSESVIIATKSVEPIEGRYKRERIEPIIYIRCQENKTDVFVNFNMFLGTRTINVTERIDSSKAKNENWYLSTDNKAIFKKSPIQFIKSLFGHNKLLLQLTPYNENPRIVEFNISGLEDIIEPLQKACKWK